MERTCKKCGETKPIEEFAKVKQNKYGYSYCCKKCTSNYTCEYQKTNSNYKEYQKKYRKAHKDYFIEYSKEYQKNNIKHLKEYNKEHYKNNIKHYKEYSKKYWRNDIDTISDRYICILFFHIGLSSQTIKQYPGLIELHRVNLKIKRFIKNQRQNENNKCKSIDKQPT